MSDLAGQAIWPCLLQQLFTSTAATRFFETGSKVYGLTNSDREECLQWYRQTFLTNAGSGVLFGLVLSGMMWSSWLLGRCMKKRLILLSWLTSLSQWRRGSKSSPRTRADALIFGLLMPINYP